MRRLAVPLLLILAGRGELAAQVRLTGRVVDSVSRAPLPSTRVIAAGTATFTDRFGRFSVELPSVPARIVFTRIGAHPDTLDLTALPEGPLEIAMLPAPVLLSDLVVNGAGDPALTDLGRWNVPVGQGLVPAAGIPDLFRELSATPAVTQSSVISARPLIRGYDAGEATLLLDGFELPNPYHLGRAFSALPVEAVDRVTVATAPLEIGIGGSSGAAVDMQGRTGDGEGVTGGAYLSPVTLTGWGGGTLGATRVFAAGRAVTIGTVATIAGRDFPYGFVDGYASVLIPGAGGHGVRGTLFMSHDGIGSGDGGDLLGWGVALAGIRADLWHRGSDRLELTGFASRYTEDLDSLLFGGSHLHVENRFSRAGLGAEWSRTGAEGRVLIGLAPGWHHIKNEVAVQGGSLTGAHQDVTQGELSAYGSWSHRIGAAMVDWGLRADLAGPTHALQPRVRAELPIGKGWTLGAAVGRSARLYHTASDPATTDELVLYDLWLVSGTNGIPVGVVDHAFLTTTWRRDALSFRAAAYASRGKGMVEVRPNTDQSLVGGSYRVGDSRTRGVELQGGLAGRGRSITLSYALTWSDRDWGDGWIPWIQDRRHLVRLGTQTGLGGAWRLSLLTEAFSAAPLTPVAYVTSASPPTPDGDPGTVWPTYVYGPEGSARGAGTIRTDLGLSRSFHGPWGSRGTLDLSVTNLMFGNVVPLVPEAPVTYATRGASGGPVRYERLFKLPAIPSIGVRFDF